MKTVHCYFDETELTIEGITYLALAGVFIKEQYAEAIREALLELKECLLEDQFTGKKEESRIFHFTEDNQHIRSAILDCIRHKNYRVYIAYKELNKPYWETYVSIIEKILFDRLQKKHNWKFKVYYEQNPKIKQHQIATKLQSMVTRIQEDHPDFPELFLEKVTKENILSSVADYVLGVFRLYHKVGRSNYMRLDFEKLRNKIRLIVDMKNSAYYDRSNPYVIEAID